MPFLKTAAILLLAVFIPIIGAKVTWADADDWEELKGDHFIVYYKGEDRFPSEVLRKAEDYYDQISTDLGYQRYSNFWQWENRVKIYIYPTREEFMVKTRQPEWSNGVASYTEKEIRSYLWGEGFLESLLPHEITHLIFRDYVGFKGEVPLWLDEGVAQWEEPMVRTVVKQTMKDLLLAGKAYPVVKLTKMDIRGEQQDTGAVSAFYVQAASIVHFLVNRFGADDFTTFCRQLRDGKSLDEALRFTYPTSMRDLNELEEKWKKFILETSP